MTTILHDRGINGDDYGCSNDDGYGAGSFAVNGVAHTYGNSYDGSGYGYGFGYGDGGGCGGGDYYTRYARCDVTLRRADDPLAALAALTLSGN